MALDIRHLELAIASLARGVAAYESCDYPAGAPEPEVMRDGVIQRFEYTFALSWKLLKRYLDEYGLERVDGLSNRDLFRIGYEQGLLADAEKWLAYLRYRNLTSQAYDEATAATVYEGARAFVADASLLLQRLQERTAASPRVGDDG